jgi:hypothetical protein
VRDGALSWPSFSTNSVEATDTTSVALGVGAFARAVTRLVAFLFAVMPSPTGLSAIDSTIQVVLCRGEGDQSGRHKLRECGSARASTGALSPSRHRLHLSPRLPGLDRGQTRAHAEGVGWI